MFALGLPELMILFAIVMVLFGGKRLPELASGMGKAIRNFKKASTATDEIEITPKNNTADDKYSAVKEKAESV